MLKGKYRLVGVVLTVVLCQALIASSGAAQQGVANKVITVGLNGPVSGSSMAGQCNLGAKVFLNEVNRNGGVNGYTFKHVERDNALQPAMGVAAAQQLIREDKVFIMAVTGSGVTKALMPMAASLKAPMLTMCDGDLARPVKENVFGMVVRYSLLPLYHAQFIIKNLNIKKLAYFYEDTAIGQPALKTLPGYVRANGAELVASLGFPVDNTDWAPYATRLKESGAQAVTYVGGGTAQLPGLQKAADAIGYHPKYVAWYANMIPQYLQLAGPLSEGVYVDTFMVPLESSNPAGGKFIDQMKRAGQENAIGALAAEGWTSGAVIEEGVRRATAKGAPLTWESFISALNTFKNVELGAYPAMTYSADDHTGCTKLALYQVQNGKFVQVSPLTEIPQAPGN